ncbi:MAG: tRNA (adenosine(37)-N6)-threonylcarbamoyltransferase complex dimerization subunit type 1 TsaB [Candidatus Rokubacteria bacterium]|nr:tRNA (adenosine(37)-N6)-threonylcarbamoyltransferase complex dimerization subunit type 1 TsaB [Candidatus Rokubacteria bacterium]
MRILGLETATLAGSAALVDGGRIVAAALLNIGLTHSERLMVAVERLLEDAAWPVEVLEGVAVSIGPGSFTGVRVGVATAKGLALASELPVAPVPTLDALAAQLPFAAAAVCPILDARKGEVYLSRYRWCVDRMEREWEYLALPPAVAARRLDPPVILLGDGVPSCLPFIGDAPDVRIAPAAQSVPSAVLVAQLGHEMLSRGQGLPADSLVPLYVRPSEAELKARARG